MLLPDGLALNVFKEETILGVLFGFILHLNASLTRWYCLLLKSLEELKKHPEFLKTLRFLTVVFDASYFLSLACQFCHLMEVTWHWPIVFGQLILCASEMLYVILHLCQCSLYLFHWIAFQIYLLAHFFLLLQLLRYHTDQLKKIFIYFTGSVCAWNSLPLEKHFDWRNLSRYHIVPAIFTSFIKPDLKKKFCTPYKVETPSTL